MFAFSRHPRRFAAALLTLIAWVTASVLVSATAALAKVGPDDPGFVTPTRSVTVTEMDWSQLALTAAAACVIGIAATLAVQLVVRHGRHPSAAHA
jgi:uncharacterized membrane protein